MISVSIIIAVYNRVDALERVLFALSEQDCRSTTFTFEVIVADDGSSSEVASLLENLKNKLPYNLLHVWQPDDGFRAAIIRNKAAAKAKGDYIIFLDGDCVPPIFFVRRHLQLAEKDWFVSGNRILLTKDFTREVITQKMPVYRWDLLSCIQARFKGFCNRCVPFIYFPLGIIRKIWAKKWQGAKSCNLAMWRQDFLAVNGFDEQYAGWGYEDSDLVIRLIRNKIRRKNGNFAVPVIHLWHKEAARNLENLNYTRLMQQQKSEGSAWVQDGVNKYLESIER